MKWSRFAVLVIAVLSLSLTRLCFAQPRASGFELDNFEPSERGSDWFAADSLDLRGHGRLALGLVADYAYKPLVIYAAADGEELGTVVKDQLFVHPGGSVVLWDRLRLGVSLPVALLQTGDGVVAGGTAFESRSGAHLGDLRLSGDARLTGVYGDPITLAAGVAAYAPTGDRDAFTSDGTFRAVLRVLGSGEVGAFVYSARLGFHLRPEDAGYAGTPTGNEITFAAAAGARIEKRWVIGPEVFGSTVVEGRNAAFARRTTPFEAVVGAHYRIGDDLHVGGAVGPGLTRGYGAPKVRVLALVEYAPGIAEKKPAARPPPADKDQDGIPDVEDACPNQAGVRTGDPKTHGCPPLVDGDRDGIFDRDDACPKEPGVRTDDPKTNGCPPPKDSDADGVIDADDACPNEPGVRTDDPKTNGCPPPKDSDGDGILDPEDACPAAPGPRSEDPKKNGCPLARVEEKQIKIIEQVKFAYNSARILPESEPILNAVMRIMTDHPEVEQIEVQGHTDNRGPDAFNQTLSEKRAASVVKWLTVHGIDRKRLGSKGLGESKPIDTNDTEDGRRNNRRVEFHIVRGRALPQ